MNQLARPFEIFLIHDNPAERKIFAVAFEDIGVPHRLTAASDGCMALDVLFHSAAPYLPDFILLSRALPKLPPGQVFKAIKADERTRPIPVMIIGSEYDARMARIENPEYCSGRLQGVEDYVELGQRIKLLLTNHQDNASC